jgi:hypothetical protein
MLCAGRRVRSYIKTTASRTLDVKVTMCTVQDGLRSASYHIISYHINITSYHTVPHHITSYHIISYHITSYHIISHHITFHHIMLYRAIFKSHVGILCKANSSLCWFEFAEIKKSRCSHRVLWRGLLPEAWTSRRMNIWHAHTERHTSPQSDGADRLDSVIHLFDPIPLKVLRLCILHSTHQRNFNVHFCAANVPH